MKTPITISIEITNSATGERMYITESKSVDDAISALGSFERREERKEVETIPEEDYSQEYEEMKEIDFNEDFWNRQAEIALSF